MTSMVNVSKVRAGGGTWYDVLAARAGVGSHEPAAAERPEGGGGGGRRRQADLPGHGRPHLPPVTPARCAPALGVASASGDR